MSSGAIENNLLDTIDEVSFPNIKAQFLAKYKKRSVGCGEGVVRANSNVQTFKVALNPFERIFLNFTKSCLIMHIKCW